MTIKKDSMHTDRCILGVDKIIRVMINSNHYQSIISLYWSSKLNPKSMTFYYISAVQLSKIPGFHAQYNETCHCTKVHCAIGVTLRGIYPIEEKKKKRSKNIVFIFYMYMATGLSLGFEKTAQKKQKLGMHKRFPLKT